MTAAREPTAEMVEAAKAEYPRWTTGSDKLGYFVARMHDNGLSFDVKAHHAALADAERAAASQALEAALTAALAVLPPAEGWPSGQVKELVDAALPFAAHDWTDAELEDDGCKLTRHSGPITVGHWRRLREAIAAAPPSGQPEKDDR